MALLIAIILVAAIIIVLTVVAIQNNKQEKEIQMRRDKQDREAREFYQKHSDLN